MAQHEWQPWDAEDGIWYFRPDDDLPGSGDCLLVVQERDGTVHATYSIQEWLDELKARSPGQHLALRMAMADEAMDRTSTEIFN